jgi:hypothetical protein
MSKIDYYAWNVRLFLTRVIAEVMDNNNISRIHNSHSLQGTWGIKRSLGQYILQKQSENRSKIAR